MPKYVLTETAYINDCLHPIGAVVDTPLRPGPHMQPFVDDKGREDKDARKAKDEALKTEASMPGNPRYIGDLIAHAMGDGKTLGRVDGASTVPRTADPAPGVTVDETGNVRGIE